MNSDIQTIEISKQALDFIRDVQILRHRWKMFEKVSCFDNTPA